MKSKMIILTLILIFTLFVSSCSLLIVKSVFVDSKSGSSDEGGGSDSIILIPIYPSDGETNVPFPLELQWGVKDSEGNLLYTGDYLFDVYLGKDRDSLDLKAQNI